MENTNKYKMKKTTKKEKIICLIIVLSICSLFIVYNTVWKIDPEKYTSYVCYDHHLSCLRTWGQYRSISSDNIDVKNPIYDDYSYRLHFRRILGETDEQFICAEYAWGFSSKKIIVQPQDNHIVPLKDWTIEKIEIGYIDYECIDTGPKMISVIDSIKDEKCIDEFKDLVLQAEAFASDSNYISPNLRRDFNNGILGIRLRFKESNNIVWITEVYTSYSDDLQHREIVIDVDSFETVNYTRNIDVNVYEYENLYNWLNEAIESES